jgi:hypothetical protein
MRCKKIIIGTGLVIISPLIAVIIRLSFLLLAGYDVDKDPKDLAREIFEGGGSVARCMHLQWSLPGMGPTLEQQRHRCVLEYADMAKDPSACELLMPSSYGLNCVGAAEDFEPCVMLADGKETVKGEGIETTFHECETGHNEIRNHVCCKMAKLLFTENRNCEIFPAGPLKDQCNHIVAVRTNDLNLCAAIQNSRNRKGCEIIVNAYESGQLN